MPFVSGSFTLRSALDSSVRESSTLYLSVWLRFIVHSARSLPSHVCYCGNALHVDLFTGLYHPLRVHESNT